MSSDSADPQSSSRELTDEQSVIETPCNTGFSIRSGETRLVYAMLIVIRVSPNLTVMTTVLLVSKKSYMKTILTCLLVIVENLVIGRICKALIIELNFTGFSHEDGSNILEVGKIRRTFVY
jgi:hypothetical protein